MATFDHIPLVTFRQNRQRYADSDAANLAVSKKTRVRAISETIFTALAKNWKSLKKVEVCKFNSLQKDRR